jgi:hypothetical protein
MPVPANITVLSTTAASNSPPGSESPALADDYLRSNASFIAQLRAVLGGAIDANIPVNLYGVGAILPPSVGNIDSVKATGIYKYANGVDTGTLPPGVTNGVVDVLTFTSAISRQTIYAVTGGSDVVSVFTRQIRGTTIIGPWVPLYEDTGAITPALLNSYTQDGTAPLTYRRIGKQVIVSGRVRRTTIPALPINIATLAAGYTPDKVITMAVCPNWLDSLASVQPLGVQVGTGGNITIAGTVGAPTGAALSGANFIDINLSFYVP